MGATTNKRREQRPPRTHTKLHNSPLPHESDKTGRGKKTAGSTAEVPPNLKTRFDTRLRIGKFVGRKISQHENFLPQFVQNSDEAYADPGSSSQGMAPVSMHLMKNLLANRKSAETVGNHGRHRFCEGRRWRPRIPLSSAPLPETRLRFCRLRSHRIPRLSHISLTRIMPGKTPRTLSAAYTQVPVKRPHPATLSVTKKGPSSPRKGPSLIRGGEAKSTHPVFDQHLGPPPFFIATFLASRLPSERNARMSSKMLHH